ncbi:hypothetical protein SKAU_G00290520 [Synaphobranchus kaupii]|uniref:Uncharacterized protein n=1 Tax=Synaphobranchus kaupii TaxID=118154 RepID=A0A9Q1ETM3_SYNKA|nr:hypothetical protein SKAU_G00290520 [Synaphobranchus kaupii]
MPASSNMEARATETAEELVTRRPFSLAIEWGVDGRTRQWAVKSSTQPKLSERRKTPRPKNKERSGVDYFSLFITACSSGSGLVVSVVRAETDVMETICASAPLGAPSLCPRPGLIRGQRGSVGSFHDRAVLTETLRQNQEGDLKSPEPGRRTRFPPLSGSPRGRGEAFVPSPSGLLSDGLSLLSFALWRKSGRCTRSGVGHGSFTPYSLVPTLSVRSSTQLTQTTTPMHTHNTRIPRSPSANSTPSSRTRPPDPSRRQTVYKEGAGVLRARVGVAHSLRRLTAARERGAARRVIHALVSFA